MIQSRKGGVGVAVKIVEQREMQDIIGQDKKLGHHFWQDCKINDEVKPRKLLVVRSESKAEQSKFQVGKDSSQEKKISKQRSKQIQTWNHEEFVWIPS